MISSSHCGETGERTDRRSTSQRQRQEERSGVNTRGKRENQVFGKREREVRDISRKIRERKNEGRIRSTGLDEASPVHTITELRAGRERQVSLCEH